MRTFIYSPIGTMEVAVWLGTEMSISFFFPV